MKIVIDIPKKDYDKMCKGELVDTILIAIKNGIPLSEGCNKIANINKTKAKEKMDAKKIKRWQI